MVEDLVASNWRINKREDFSEMVRRLNLFYPERVGLNFPAKPRPVVAEVDK
jgi:hypothetical protein